MVKRSLPSLTSYGWVFILLLTGTVPAFAADGVIEINQARAKAGGVTPGDTPLFPVTISQPGSYRLTGNSERRGRRPRRRRDAGERRHLPKWH